MILYAAIHVVEVCPFFTLPTRCRAARRGTGTPPEPDADHQHHPQLMAHPSSAVGVTCIY